MKEQETIQEIKMRSLVAADHAKRAVVRLLPTHPVAVSGKINSPKGRNSRTFAPNFEKI
jgi:hypothetical protein